MQDRPTALELLAAVRAFLEDDVLPCLEGRKRFHGPVAVNILGKVKTVAQLVAIPFLLYNHYLFGIDTNDVGRVLIWVAAVLTLWSMVVYLRAALAPATKA